MQDKRLGRPGPSPLQRKLRVTAGCHTSSISIGLSTDLTFFLPLEKSIANYWYCPFTWVQELGRRRGREKDEKVREEKKEKIKVKGEKGK